MTEAYANLTFTMRYYQSDDATRKGSHIPFNFLMISDLNKESSANDFVHTISKWLNYMPAGETANWVVSEKIVKEILHRVRFFIVLFCSSEITTIHELDLVTVQSE